MSYIVIPLQTKANQQFSCVLDGGATSINLLTTDAGLLLSGSHNGITFAASRLCLDRTDINAARYLGLPQALCFVDVQGQSDPQWPGFNTRYLLCYGDPQTNGGAVIA